MVTDQYGRKTHLGWNEYSLKVLDNVQSFRRDEYRLSTKLWTNYYCMGPTRLKHASIGTHGDLNGKESVIGTIIWLVGNRTHLSAT